MKIEVKDYTKVLKGAIVLNHINLRLESGKIYGFIGRNGSGKTMLLRGIAGLIHPTRGYITFDGRKMHEEFDFPPDLGLLLERPGFLGYLTGMENLKMLAEIRNKIDENRISEWMKTFHLDPFEKKKFKRYSLGMKQKIGVIQALMEDPNLIILDEPFNALDEESVLTLKEILIKKKKEGALILLTSHHKEDIDFLCDEVYEIINGEIKSVIERK